MKRNRQNMNVKDRKARNRRSPSASSVNESEKNTSPRGQRIRCSNPISACDASPQERENFVCLHDGSNTLKLSLPAKHHCTNVALQIGAVIVAVTFGAFAVQAVRLSNHANHYAALAVNQSIAQNQMAMYAICISLQVQIQSNATLPFFCNQVFAEGQDVLRSITNALFTYPQAGITSELQSTAATLPSPSVAALISGTPVSNSTISSVNDAFVSRSRSSTITAFASPIVTSYSSFLSIPATANGTGVNWTYMNYIDSKSTSVVDSLAFQILGPVLVLSLVAVIVIGVKAWRRRRQRLRCQRDAETTPTADELERNPLLAEWAQAMGSKTGLELLGEKLQDSRDQESAVLGTRGADWLREWELGPEPALEELAVERAWEYCSSDGY